MKKQVFTLVSLFITASLSFGQLSFYSSDRKVETASCETSDLKVKIVVPKMAGTYDALKVMVKVAPNSSLVSLHNYEVDLPKSYTEGKTEVSLRLKTSKNVSDFYAFGQNVSNVIKGPCNNKARTEQFYTLSFQILGMKLTGYKLKTVNNETQNVAQYSTVVIEKYPDAFKMDFGEVSDGFVSSTGKFSLKRYPELDVKIQETGSSPLLLAGQTQTRELSYLFNGNDDNNDYVLLNVRLLCQSESSVAQAQDDILNTLKKYANNSVSADRSKITASKTDFKQWMGWIEAYYPGFSLHPGKSGNKEFDSRMKAMTKQEVVWQDKKVGNLDCKYLELDTYYDWQVSKNDGTYRKYIRKDYQEKTRKLVLFIGEKGGEVFVGTMYKIGKDHNFSAGEQKFWDEILNSFTAL